MRSFLRRSAAKGGQRTVFRRASSVAQAARNRRLRAIGLFGTAATAVTTAALWGPNAAASDDVVHVPEHPWPNQYPWQAFDRHSIRRGWTVFQQVCSQCHSLNLIAYRNLVDNVLTLDEAKEMAADVDIEDGPDEDGEMFDRPGKLSDLIPGPYANEQEARVSNGGALPPDLSVIIKARHGGPDYVFGLLTGYKNPPAGVPELREGLHYNPYFPGGAIGMAPPLLNDMVEYEDGTPATVSQMAKDVSHFLHWTAEPEHDERKRMGMKAIFILTVMAGTTLYWKRLKWSVIKSRKIKFH